MRQDLFIYKILCVIILLCIASFEAQAQTNIAPSATVSVSSQFQSGYDASDLIDGNTTASDWTVGWYADFFNSSNPQYCTFDFGVNGAIINRYDLYGHSTTTVNPDSHKFQGSNSLSDPWTDLNTVTTKVSTGQNTYNISNTTNYRYYRVLMTENGGASGTGGFQEVEMFGALCFPTAGTATITACDSYTWIDGNTYTSNNNTATHTLTNALGCDSVVTLNLTINNSNTGTATITACDSYTWIDGNTYTSSNNTATHTLTNIEGCDSVVTLNLTINNSNTGTDVQVACDSYTWIDGNTYTSSNNTATHTLTNTAGCDSVVTLNLTINNSNTGTATITACGSYTWIDGNTYTSNNNTATHTLTNAAGCDSVVTLNLTIGNPNTGTATITACDSYTWIDGNTYTSSNNTATHTLTNAASCDSVVTLNLTISSSNTGTDIVSACGSYTWIDGNTYTEDNNTATHTLTNTAGCDSVVTINLTINNLATGTATITACDSYTWIDGNTYTESNNTATLTLARPVGCDSVVTLNLTILESSTGVDVQAACESFTWIDGNTYTESNNTATHTLTNAIGCDSVVTLNLTIPDIDSTITQNGNTLSSNLENASYQWFICTNNSVEEISGATNQTYTPDENGDYSVRVTIDNCSVFSECISFTLTSAHGLSDAKEKIKIFPNPAQSKIKIQIPESSGSDIAIFNSIGLRVYSRQGYISGEEINISSLKSGLYIIEVSLKGKNKHYVFIKK